MELFNSRSTSDTSDVFVLGPGEAMVLSAFNLVEQQRAVVQKVRYAQNTIPTGSACKDALVIDPAMIKGAEDVTQCGVWALNPCQNVAILTVPGYYRLRLDDGVAAAEVPEGVPIPVAESTAVGTALIYGEKFTAQEVAVIPKDLFFGQISGCSCGG